MKKTMIALVATIMAGACVFFACSKEEENNICGNTEKCLEKCKEFQEMLGEDAVIIGFASFDNPEEFFYSFDFDVLAEKFHNYFKEKMGIYVMLEDISIFDEDLRNSILQPLVKFSIIAPESPDEASATLSMPIEKLTNEEKGITIYYVPAGEGGTTGGTEPAYGCISKKCNKSCMLITDRDPQGRLLKVWCDCMGDKGYCKLTDGASWWDVLCSSIGKWFTVNITISKK